MYNTIIGINVPWFEGAYGHDLGRNLAYPEWPVVYNRENVHELLEYLKSFDIHLLRIWLFERSEGLIYDNKMRVFDLDPFFYLNLSDLVSLLAEQGFQVYWTLLDANSVLREGDEVTRRLLIDPEAIHFFCCNVLNEVLPLIAPVSWAIDLCNEPEAFERFSVNKHINRKNLWRLVRNGLELLCNHVRNLMPTIPISVGSGFNEYRNWQNEKIYGGLKGKLNFLDYHTYLASGYVIPKSKLVYGENNKLQIVLGEVGCQVKNFETESRLLWKTLQVQMTQKLHSLSESGYYAAFLWYLTQLDSSDVTSLVYKHEAGLALHNIKSLREQKKIRILDTK